MNFVDAVAPSATAWPLVVIDYWWMFWQIMTASWNSSLQECQADSSQSSPCAACWQIFRGVSHRLVEDSRRLDVFWTSFKSFWGQNASSCPTRAAFAWFWGMWMRFIWFVDVYSASWPALPISVEVSTTCSDSHLSEKKAVSGWRAGYVMQKEVCN